MLKALFSSFIVNLVFESLLKNEKQKFDMQDRLIVLHSVGAEVGSHRFEHVLLPASIGFRDQLGDLTSQLMLVKLTADAVKFPVDTLKSGSSQSHVQALLHFLVGHELNIEDLVNHRQNCASLFHEVLIRRIK